MKYTLADRQTEVVLSSFRPWQIIKGDIKQLRISAVVLCLLFLLIILTLGESISPMVTGAAGILCCAAGVVRSGMRADLRIAVPLLCYIVFSIISSYVTTGDPFRGYVFVQMVVPVIFLLMATLTDEERFTLRMLCMTWAVIIAVIGIVQFISAGFTGTGERLAGVFDNANVMGIFLVMSWFALVGCDENNGAKRSVRKLPGLELLRHVEPVILMALALTLSMGSFGAMAVGIIVLIICRKRQVRDTDVAALVLSTLSRASVEIGTGVMLYVAVRLNSVWLCGAVLIYEMLLVLKWRRWAMPAFSYRITAAVFSGAGLLTALAAVFFRPSSVATFTERLEMIRNGAMYISGSPLTGCGPLRWHIMNAVDGDKYFNTTYIHDMFVHIGAELGLPAMVMLAIIVIASLVKKRPPWSRAGLAALTTHYLLDIGFSYMGVAAAAMMLLGVPGERSRTVDPVVSKAIFFALAALLACGMYSEGFT